MSSPSALSIDQNAGAAVSESGTSQSDKESGQGRRPSASTTTSPGLRTRSGSSHDEEPKRRVQPKAQQSESASTKSSIKSPGAERQLTRGSGETRISVTDASPSRAARLRGVALRTQGPACQLIGPHFSPRTRVAVTVAPNRRRPKRATLLSALPKTWPLSRRTPRVSISNQERR